LAEGLKISGKSTYSAMVNEALEEYCRLRRVEEIYKLKGSGIWEGSLAEMRNDYATDKKTSPEKGKASGRGGRARK